MGSVSTLHSYFNAGNNRLSLPKKRSHPLLLPRPLHSCPQTALIYTNMNGEAEQTPDPG